jgi:hypothetical protein
MDKTWINKRKQGIYITHSLVWRIFSYKLKWFNNFFDTKHRFFISLKAPKDHLLICILATSIYPVIDWLNMIRRISMLHFERNFFRLAFNLTNLSIKLTTSIHIRIQFILSIFLDYINWSQLHNANSVSIFLSSCPCFSNWHYFFL